MRDPRVDDYISDAAPFARPILKRLRRLVHSGCPDAVESIKWSCPHFLFRDSILCSMAAFKEHCAFGFWHRDMASVMSKEKGKASEAMGQFGRITSVKDLPDDRAIAGYVRTASGLIAGGAPARPRSTREPAEVVVPAALTAALKRNAAAGKHFEALSTSHRREYAEWIADAKRDETRQRRIATALEWLSTGKSRNWKYEGC